MYRYTPTDGIQCRGLGPPLSHMCGCPRIKRLDSYESKSKFIRYSEAFFFNLFHRGPFMGQKPKILPKMWHFVKNHPI